jgi:hypothetical protein
MKAGVTAVKDKPVRVKAPVHHSIRSKERVRELGEVFTPPKIVNDMIDMVENAAKESGRPLVYNSTWLEPACGPKGFILEVLRRKLRMVEALDEVKKGIKNGDFEPYEFKSISALASIYGNEIDTLNINECRFNFKELLLENYYDISGGKEAPNRYVAAIDYILARNIFQANFLDDTELANIDIIEFIEKDGCHFERRYHKFTDLYKKEKKAEQSLFPEEEYSVDNPRRILEPVYYGDLRDDK